MVSKNGWQGCPIGDLQFDLASGKGYLLWGDEIKNVWLEASFSNPIFFKQSHYLEDWEIVFASLVSICKVPQDSIISYLRDLGYKAIFQEQWPELYHLCIEADGTVDIVCEKLDVSKSNQRDPPFV